MKNVCCCCNYKLGIIILGMILMISSTIYYYIWVESYTEFTQIKGIGNALIINSFIVTMFLICGTIKESRYFFLPWMVYEIIFLTITFSYWCIFTFVESFQAGLFLLIFNGPRTALGIYYWVIICRFWGVLERKESGVVVEKRENIDLWANVEGQDNHIFFSKSSSPSHVSSFRPTLPNRDKALLNNKVPLNNEGEQNSGGSGSDGYVIVLPNALLNNAEYNYDYVDAK